MLLNTGLDKFIHHSQFSNNDLDCIRSTCTHPSSCAKNVGQEQLYLRRTPQI